MMIIFWSQVAASISFSLLNFYLGRVCCYVVLGILIEGLGSFLDGLLGTGNGTTSTSINVGVVSISKVDDEHDC